MKAKIQEDVKAAMKAQDTLKRDTLRGWMSEIKLAEINSQTTLSDEQCLAIAQKEIKKRRDAIDFAKQGGREDIVTQNETEIKILQGYLGEQLSEAKLREVITGLISGGADNIGKIMGALNKDYKGKFEGKSASEIAKQLLG